MARNHRDYSWVYGLVRNRLLHLHERRSRARAGNGWATIFGPECALPEKWHWPVGVSLSTEIGYQRRAFSADTWTWEIRPIIDQKKGRWYWAFNPALERSFHGPSVNQGVAFSPNVKLSYDFTPKISGGFEYYGAVGPVTGFDPLREQEQQIFPAIDLNLSPDWEFNFGVGIGMTGSTDHLLDQNDSGTPVQTAGIKLAN